MAPRKEQDNGASAEQHTADEFQVPEGWANVLFENAVHLQEQYDRLIGARKANRDSLRNLAKQGLLTDEERELLAELYPERGKTAEAPEATPEPATA